MKLNIVLVTVESLRYDYRQHFPLPDGFDSHKGITMGHYTRPSLAGLLGGQYIDALQTRPSQPTLAERLKSEGYSTMAVSYSPQTATGMGFEAGFGSFEAIEGESGVVDRGTGLREQLAEFAPVRAIHRRIAPKGATLDEIPRDSSALEAARELFVSAKPPRFLWVHLMDTHRPYGRGENALPAKLDSKAAAAGPRRSQRALSEEEHAELVDHYREALKRQSDRLDGFLSKLPADSCVIVAGDHGEELGENGFYYHGGYRRRLVDELITVPVWTRGIDIDVDTISLADVAPLICGRAGISSPDEWDGSPDARSLCRGALSVAPWNERSSIRWQNNHSDITVLEGDVQSLATELEINEEVTQQLQALGYASSGK